MQLIAALEPRPRGAYTGAIGFTLPAADGGVHEAVFSVAIRTLEVRDGVGRLGVGAGIVVDSDADAEHAEVQAKARFLTDPDPPLGLFETLRWEGGRAPRWGAHRARLAASAAHFGVPFDPAAAAAALAAAVADAGDGRDPTLGSPAVLRVRLDLHEDGRCTATARPHADDAPGTPGAPAVAVALADVRVRADDPARHHKTRDRTTYDVASAWATAHGLADVVFLNEHGRVAEGAISTVFVRDDDGVWRTPPLREGALPGVLRAALLADGAAREGVVSEADLRERELAIGSALRGLRRARLDPVRRWRPSEEETR